MKWFRLLSTILFIFSFVGAYGCIGEIEEELAEDEQTIALSEEDFAFEIGTLPYRGAVLFIDYKGEVALSDYNLFFNVISDGEIKQENMPVEEVDGKLTATIVDLMYLLGDELNFVIKIQDDSGKEIELDYSEVLEQRYPWKDWIFDTEEPISLIVTNTQYNFKYYYPEIGSGLGAHSSWDFMTRFSDEVDVYSGTEGIVWQISEYSGEYNVYLYNPYVGAIIQNGHLAEGISLRNGQNIYSGEYLGRIALSSIPHNHYSVIRPLGYTKNLEKARSPWLKGKISTQFNDYYWPIIYSNVENKDIFDSKYYKDPFYFHEPTTLGYWNEETLPNGLKEELLKIFKRDNPNIVLPATEPLEPLD